MQVELVDSGELLCERVEVTAQRLDTRRMIMVQRVNAGNVSVRLNGERNLRPSLGRSSGKPSTSCKQIYTDFHCCFYVMFILFSQFFNLQSD